MTTASTTPHPHPRDRAHAPPTWLPAALVLLAAATTAAAAPPVRTGTATAAPAVVAAPAAATGSGAHLVVLPLPAVAEAVEGDDDVRVTIPAWNSGDPDLAITSDGQMWTVAENLGSGNIDVYSSDTGGAGWSYEGTLTGTVPLSRPSLAIGEDAARRVLIAYEADRAGTAPAIEVFWYDLDLGTSGSSVVYQGGADAAHPRLCADNPEHADWYAYIVFTVASGIHGQLYANVSRSLDHGASWQAPTQLAGVLAPDCRPDIDYGGATAYLTVTTSGTSRDVEVQHSSDRGASWSARTTLAGSADEEYHPRVAASNGGGAVVVAYTHDNRPDTDIEAYVSTNAGTSWSWTPLPATPLPEDWVDLGASRALGKIHAAYHSGSRIRHSWAAIATPDDWQRGLAVDDSAWALQAAPPAVAANPQWVAEECVVWSDYRAGSQLGVYFDRGAWSEAVVAANGSGDFPTVQSALDDAQAGASILLQDGVFDGLGNVDLDFLGKDLEVRSLNGVASACIIDCRGSAAEPHRGFHFHSGETAAAAVRRLTIRNGYAGPAAKSPSAVYGTGGGALVEAGSCPTFEGVMFRDNTAIAGGGGLYWESEPSGKAAAPATLSTISECKFVGNAASTGGGGLHYVIASAPTIARCVFYENFSDDGAGALQCENGVDATVLECSFVRNGGPDAGGILLLNGSHAEVAYSLVAFGLEGAAVHCDATSSASLYCSDVYGNPGGDWVGCLAGQLTGNLADDPLFCEVLNHNLALAETSPCLPELSPCGQLIGYYGIGCSTPTAVRPAPPPAAASLGCAPNPFNPRTVLRYLVPAAGRVRLSVYDLSGRRLATLVDGPREAGWQEAVWRGRDDRGRSLPSGVYVCRLLTVAGQATREVVLLR